MVSEETLPNGQKKKKFGYGAEQSVFVTDIEEKYITGTRIVCWGSNSKVQSSWRELFYHQHKRYPTMSELNNMTYKNAWDWFRDKYKDDSGWCWPNGTQYPDVDQDILNDQPVHPIPTKRTSTSSICFDWIDPMITPGDPEGQFLPFFWRFVTPNGDYCDIKSIVAKSVVKPKEGQTLNIKLKVVQPCFICF